MPGCKNGETGGVPAQVRESEKSRAVDRRAYGGTRCLQLRSSLRLHLDSRGGGADLQRRVHIERRTHFHRLRFDAGGGEPCLPKTTLYVPGCMFAKR